MLPVISRQQPLIHAAYQATPVPIAVSVKSVYNQLNSLEPGTSAALVRHSTEQATALIAMVGGAQPGLLAGYRVKILDGSLAGLRRAARRPRPGWAKPLNIRIARQLGTHTPDAAQMKSLNLQTGLLSSTLEHAVPEQMFVTPENRGGPRRSHLGGQGPGQGQCTRVTDLSDYPRQSRNNATQYPPSSGYHDGDPHCAGRWIGGHHPYRCRQRARLVGGGVYYP